MNGNDPMNEIDIRSAFIGESRERIDRLSHSALQLEDGHADSLSEILADLHGFKGTAAVAGLGELSKTCHRLEDVLNALRSDDSVFADQSELNELTAQTVLDFCDFATAYCEAVATDAIPPLPPAFLSGDDRPMIAAKLKPFETKHGIRGKLEDGAVSISVPQGTTAKELQEAITNFQHYITATPRGVTWTIDLSDIRIIDLPFAGELYVLQENLRERHGVLMLNGVRRSACSPSLLERMQRRFRVTMIEE